MKLVTITIFLCAVAAATVNAAALDDKQLETLNGRIIGGQNAIPHSAPYLVTLHATFGAITSHQCGGSIISPSWVATAAHCFVPGTGPFFMMAGRHNIHIAEQTEQRRYINRARFFSYPLYDGLRFDIALVHAAPAFTYNAFVSQIALPAAGFIHSGVGTVFGWGLISQNPSVLPSILQTAQLPILPAAQCFAIWGSSFDVTNLCAGVLAGGVDTCTADSGGPLVQAGQLVGITSWGAATCALPNTAGVYVRTSAFNAWIASTMLL